MVQFVTGKKKNHQGTDSYVIGISQGFLNLWSTDIFSLR